MFFLWICLFIPNVPHSFQPIDVSHIQKFMVQKPLIKGCLRGDLQSRVLTFWGGLLIRCWHYIYMYIYIDIVSVFDVHVICFPTFLYTNVCCKATRLVSIISAKQLPSVHCALSFSLRGANIGKIMNVVDLLNREVFIYPFANSEN